MGNLHLNDLWGCVAYERMLDTSVEPSKAFQDCIHRLWQSSGLNSLDHSAWPVIKDKLLPITDPNNALEAYEVCKAIKHLRTPQDFYSDTENMSLEEKGFWKGLPGKAFSETAGRFPGTVLGDYCTFVSSPPSEYQGLPPSQTSLLFNNTIS